MLGAEVLPSSDAARPAWPQKAAIYNSFFGKGSSGNYQGLLGNRADTKSEQKVLCAIGAVALAEMVWSGAGARRGWSGLFGGDSSGVGLLRLSSAAQPPNASGGGRAASFLLGSLGDANVFPCVAFKVPRSHAPSANLLFLGRKTGQADPNFFGGCVASCATEKCSALVGKVIDGFRAHTAYPCHVGLSDAATCGCDGRSASPVAFPWAIVLKPTAEARASLPPEPEIKGSTSGDHPCNLTDLPCNRFLRQLGAMTAGTALYDVFAVATPRGARPGGAGAGAEGSGAEGLVRIGQLVSRSAFVRSGAERGVHFWHQRKEDDYALRPEWAAAHGEHQRLVCGAEFFAKLLESGLYAED
jgi:hypothetical protein